MEMQSVKSSAIAKVGYADGVLDVEFRNGHHYRHEGIDRKTFDAFLAAESMGAFYNKTIRPSCTSCTRVERKQAVQAAQ